MTRRARFTQSDIARVLRAAVQCGQRMVVEVMPDGTMRLFPAEDEHAPKKPVVKKREIVL